MKSDNHMLKKLLALDKVLKNPFGDDGLSKQQRVAATHAARGLTGEEVAEQMGITAKTAYMHLARACVRLETNRLGLVKLYVERIEEAVK